MASVISRFDFEGGILVLISPVPGHCMLVTSDVVLYLTCFDVSVCTGFVFYVLDDVK